MATDGYVYLPQSPDPCSDFKKKLYVFGFVGGLFKVTNGNKTEYINTKLDWTNPDNYDYLYSLQSTAQLPSPLIWGEVNDKIYITLINLGMPIANLPDLHTVHIHGAHVASQLDGFPETSFGVPMWMFKDKNDAPPTATYYFNPEHPGTYMYHCHVEASEHIQMGMYGALIIYPSMASLKQHDIYKSCGKWFSKGIYQKQIPSTATNRNFAYNNIKSYYDKEYVMLLSDIDSKWHDTVEAQKTYYAPDFKPDFWLVNGRAYPDTLKPHPLTITSSNANTNLTQLNYESYVHIKTNDKVLFRMINMEYAAVPWHIHGWHFQVIGKDTFPSPFLAISENLMNMDMCTSSYTQHELLENGFTANIASGETYDLLITATDKRNEYLNYIKKGQNGLPSLCKQVYELAQIDSNSIANIPTNPIGQCPNLNTTNILEICNDKNNSYFFPQFYHMHNHDDYKVTNQGVYPGGQLTLIQTDAPTK